MEASEDTPTPDIAPEEDPFADVEADPLAGAEEAQPLPPGVEQGSLGGTDLTDEEKAAAEEGVPDPEAEEAAEEGEPLPPEDPPPPGEEPVEQPEEPEEPAAEESLIPGDDAAVVEPGEAVPPPEEEPEPVKEEQPEPETPVEGKEGAEVAASPEPEKPKRSRAKRGGGKKRGKKPSGDERQYVVLKETKPGAWVEAFARDAKGDGLVHNTDEPTTIIARNGEVALRRAYRILTGEDDPVNYVLVATPQPYFKPKPVNGRVHKQTAISIGG